MSGVRIPERCEGDRHHFRYIVSPQDAEQLDELPHFLDSDFSIVETRSMRR
jgi:hypothetical protein